MFRKLTLHLRSRTLRLHEEAKMELPFDQNQSVAPSLSSSDSAVSSVALPRRLSTSPPTRFQIKIQRGLSQFGMRVAVLVTKREAFLKRFDIGLIVAFSVAVAFSMPVTGQSMQTIAAKGTTIIGRVNDANGDT